MEYLSPYDSSSGPDGNGGDYLPPELPVADPAPSPIKLWQERDQWFAAPAMSERVHRQWWANVRLRWDCHSTAIEGSQLSYQDTVTILVHGRSPDQPGKLLDIDQIRGHDAGTHRLAAMVNKSHFLTLEDLHEIQRMMLVRSYPATDLQGRRSPHYVALGVYKRHTNALHAGTHLVEFATPQSVPSLMQAWLTRLHQRLNIVRQDRTVLDPAGVLAASHWDFIAIHPYDDGNGRVARWVTNYMAMAMGVPPLVITLDQKEAYFDALAGMDPLHIPAPAAAFRSLRDFFAHSMADSLRFACAVARGQSDPTWANTDASPARPASLAPSVYPSDSLVPLLRPQDRSRGPDGSVAA